MPDDNAIECFNRLAVCEWRENCAAGVHFCQWVENGERIEKTKSWKLSQRDAIECVLHVIFFLLCLVFFYFVFLLFVSNHILRYLFCCCFFFSTARSS